MDQFERQFEHLDVQTQTMEEAMSGVTTLTVPEVRDYGLIFLTTHTRSQPYDFYYNKSVFMDYLPGVWFVCNWLSFRKGHMLLQAN